MLDLTFMFAFLLQCTIHDWLKNGWGSWKTLSDAYAE